ncbi:Transcriptional regulator [Paraburkholderia dioscoreae]|uniref:Transcriptional regulator n=2 Tax=Paraburkholderia dioscoreae TaxID=2604047 RepID=A0A5Q4ZUJ0_9BURK|nr:Transcriptional regulator [Paraburkholderia dioscoreae]
MDAVLCSRRYDYWLQGMRNTKDGRTLNTAMFDQLREAILTGKLLPGQRLKVSLMAQTHGVSLNVVREALNRLAGEQWVEIEPQHGFRVRALTAEDLIDLVRQRAIFEGIALRQSIARGDVEWQSKVVAAHHRLSRTPVGVESEPERVNPEWLARHEEFNIVMMEACGSPRLVQIVRQLAEASAMYHRALLPAVSAEGELESEHTALLDAILAGDADLAVRVLTTHLEQTRDLMLPMLAKTLAPTEIAAEPDHVRPPEEKRRRGRPPGSRKVQAAVAK